jgi:hypothetical protein
MVTTSRAQPSLDGLRLFQHPKTETAGSDAHGRPIESEDRSARGVAAAEREGHFRLSGGSPRRPQGHVA